MESFLKQLKTLGIMVLNNNAPLAATMDIFLEIISHGVCKFGIFSRIINF